MANMIHGPGSDDYNGSDGTTESISRCIVSASTETYQYLPLSDDSSFRLLTIRPASSETAPLTLSLEIVRLRDTLPTYEALSYVWSQERGHESAICDGRLLDNISTNLYEALLALRRADTDRVIWVDALCIRQDDEVEKGMQVRKMHHVYAGAERVVVWLGRGPELSAPTAFSLICALVNEEGFSNGDKDNSSANTEPATYYYLQNGRESPQPTPTVLPAVTDRSAWKSIRTLFENKWFLRLWVLQEIVLARSATLFWGPYSLRWATLERAITRIYATPELDAYLESRALQNASFMQHLRELHRSPESGLPLRDESEDAQNRHPFLYLLDIGRSFDVSEPRDKVYGMLGFPTRDTALEKSVFIVPDYNKGVGAVFAEVAWKVIRRDKDLNVLSFVVGTDDEHSGNQNGTSKKKFADLPSWVPDWTSKTVIYPLVGIKPRNQHHAGTFRRQRLADSHLDPHTNSLSVHGATLTTVSSVSPYIPYTPFSASDNALVDLISWYLSPGSASQHTSSKLTLRTLALTLTAGRNHDGTLIAPDVEPQHVAHMLALFARLGFSRSALHDTLPDPDNLAYRMREEGLKGDAEIAREAVWRFSCYRRGFRTVDGQIGLGAGGAQAGDSLVVLWGGQVPVLLRSPKESGDDRAGFRFVGEAYVEEWVGGEVERMLERGEVKEARFQVL